MNIYAKQIFLLQGAYKLETAEQTAPTGSSVHFALLDLENDMRVAADKAEETVKEIDTIAYSLDAGSGIIYFF